MKRALLVTRLSYASSEVGGQLIFCVVSFYLLKFYTDVYGLSAAVAGSILLLARFVDAIDAPLWGIVFDKTHSRWGKSRPWFLWLCGPFALFGVLTFVTPELGGKAKAIYAAATYMVCSMLYTGINTPVTSILSGLTHDSRERVALTTVRMFGSKFGVLIVNLTVIRMVAWLGNGNDRHGFMLVMPIYAVCSVLLYLFAFRNLVESVPERRQGLAIRESFGALQGNAPWFIIFASSLLFWIAFIARISSAPYFFQYVLHRPRLTAVANSLDAVSLVTVMFLPWLCRRMLKCNVWMGGLAGCVAGQLVMQLGLSAGRVPLIMVGWVLGFLASGIAMAIPFSILSDSVDYGEWKSGVRAAGLLTSLGAAFCLKAGSGLGGALPAWLLSHYAYVPNVEQSARSLNGICLSFVWLPAIAYGLAFVPVLFYQRYERIEPAIQRELGERRMAAALLSGSV